MPVGVLTNAAAVVAGGMIGGVFGKYFPRKVCAGMQNVFGFCAVSIGITLIVKLEALAAVVLAMVLGTAAGEFMDIERFLERIGQCLTARAGAVKENGVDMGQLISLLMLVTTASTGMIGSMTEGMGGSSEILYAKSVLDFFTVIIFSAGLGFLPIIIAIPFLMVNLPVFFMAEALSELMAGGMLGNFMACGGIITLATGIRICKIKDVRAANMLPSLLIVLPVSYIWSMIFI